MNLIERATSGFPLFVVDSADESGIYFSYNGYTFQRPNEVGNPNQGGPEGGNTNCPAKVHTLQNWFNPCAFAQAPTFVINLGLPRLLRWRTWHRPARAGLWPRFVNTDFSVFKDFPLPFREAMNLQFRAEFFNLFNHAQFFLNGFGGTGEQDINTPSSFGVINQHRK